VKLSSLTTPSFFPTWCFFAEGLALSSSKKALKSAFDSFRRH